MLRGDRCLYRLFSAAMLRFRRFMMPDTLTFMRRRHDITPC